MKKKLRINYLSHGKFKTGGFRHEKFFAEALTEYLQKDNEVELNIIRAERSFEGFGPHLRMLAWAFGKANADVNIVVARLALPALLRNLFSKRKVFIVLHYFDERDQKKSLLAMYYRLLFALLRVFSPANATIITVADFWVAYFKNKLNDKVRVVLFPNLFDNIIYQPYQTNDKKKRIHLGQYSWKNDPLIFALAEQLHQKGYSCYFSTNDEQEAMKKAFYEVRFFPKFSDYLKHMAESLCTVCLPAINEGWNRVAHESILVGTPVVGYARGGLGQLLQESGSVVVNEASEVLDRISSIKLDNARPFINSYDSSQKETYIRRIVAEAGL
jgi:glycosyltransferase involved in cell wall biosynthesis